jgi:hypothetical protein
MILLSLSVRDSNEDEYKLVVEDRPIPALPDFHQSMTIYYGDSERILCTVLNSIQNVVVDLDGSMRLKILATKPQNSVQQVSQNTD